MFRLTGSVRHADVGDQARRWS